MSSVERSTHRDLQQVQAELVALPAYADGREDADEIPEFDGRLASYVAHAFANSPELRVSFEEWRAATHEPRQARRLPEPELTFGVFVRPMHTVMGPIRAQLSAMQTFPWPTKLTAGGTAAAHRAQAAQRRFEAHALELAAQVARPYWKLWHAKRLREIEEHDIAILESLSDQVRARVEVGTADLAQLAQVHLRLLQARDRLAELDPVERALSAELVRAVGAPMATPTPIVTDPPSVAPPAETLTSLAASATEHPRVTSMIAMSESSREQARAARADRYPRFGLGVEWMIMGEPHMMQSVVHEGGDPVMLMGTVSLPLWQRSYGAAVERARADESAFRARALSARNQVLSETQAALARIDSEVRRAQLYEHTIVPQAEATLESVMASYVAGRSGIAELLMAERELLHARHGIIEVQVDYALELAELERIVGRPIELQQVDHGRD